MRGSWQRTALLIGLAWGLGPRTTVAQAWDTGRNMFGFAQYYPGSGWSSFYHPDFDPAAFFPTTFGWRSAVAHDPGPETTRADNRWARPAAGPRLRLRYIFRRRRP